jgi:uncharacterized membrane protein
MSPIVAIIVLILFGVGTALCAILPALTAVDKKEVTYIKLGLAIWSYPLSFEMIKLVVYLLKPYVDLSAQ